MGFFNFKKKKTNHKQHIMKLLCSENDLNSNKAILLGLYRNLQFDVVWRQVDYIEDQFSNALKNSELDNIPSVQDGDFSTAGVS